MTTPNSLITPQTLDRGLLQFHQGIDSPGIWATLYSNPGTSGARINAIVVTNNDSVAHPVSLSILSGGKNYTINTVNVPSTAGFVSGILPVSLLWQGLPLDQYGNPYVQIIPGDVLQAYFANALISPTSMVSIVATVMVY